jgi:hypothetical protein
MKKVIFALLLIPFAVFFSCKKNSENRVDDLNIKSIRLHSEEEAFIDTAYFKTGRMVQLETNENSFIREIKKIMFDDDRFFIFDKSLNCIFIFNSDGKYLNDIKKVGNGPGEYTQLLTVCLDTTDKQLILCSDAPYKFLFFDYSGNFIKEQRMDNLCREIVCKENKIYTTNLIPNSTNDYCYLYETDKKTYAERCIFNIPDLPSCNVYINGNYLTNNQHINFTTRFDNIIYSMENRAVKAKYLIDFGKLNFPESYKNFPEEKIDDICLDGQYIHSIVEINESDNYLYFKTNSFGWYIYSKKEDLLKKYTFVEDSKYGLYCSNMISVEGSNAISFIVDWNILYNYKEYREKRKILIKPDFLDMFEKMEPDDNPILLIYESK